MTIAVGIPVFQGESNAQAWRWDDIECGINPSHNDVIIIASHLQNSLVLWAIQHSAIGIVTESGVFACHAANILRAASAAGRSTPFWITDCKGVYEIISGTSLTCGMDGKVSWNNWAETIPESHADTISYSYRLPQTARIRDVVAYQIDTNRWWRCYWPHRQYDRLTASLMAAGLSHDVSFKCIKTPVEIYHGDDGLLWFDFSAPRTADLISTAVDVNKGSTLVERQITLYETIVNRLAHLDHNESSYASKLIVLVPMIVDYFTSFMTFHKTYEYVYLELERQLLSFVDENTLISFMNSVMVPEIIRWQQNSNLCLINKKDLFECTHIINAPNFSIRDDIKLTLNRVYNRSQCITSINSQTEINSYIIYAVNVAIVKEWKFYINKMLFSRFSNWVRPCLSTLGVSCVELRELSIKDLLLRLA